MEEEYEYANELVKHPRKIPKITTKLQAFQLCYRKTS